jgi:SAM-dependent MidA family methyltransferase
MNLRTRIAEEIRQRGPIPFSRYMELCLYDPEHGYYSREKEQFGKAGDFYTASDVHSVFGRLLARQFDEMWRALEAPARIDIIELGPGRGLFAHDVLAWSRKKFPDFLAATHYTMVESSRHLRARLRERFSGVHGEGTAQGRRAGMGEVAIVSGIEELPALTGPMIVFANEFFDALPVEVIDQRGALRIGCEDDRFVECYAEPAPEELEFVKRHGIPPQTGRVEATLAAADFMRRVCGRMKQGFLIAIDYGYTREELLAGRAASSVRAFRQHTISDSPYEAPGEQDITANVNFTALRAAGMEAGMEAGILLTQAQFLMGIGEANQFADAFEDVQSPQEQAKVAMQLKNLVTPAGMGEVFQVLVMRRGVEKEEAMRLAGLRYGRGE